MRTHVDASVDADVADAAGVARGEVDDVIVTTDGLEAHVAAVAADVARRGEEIERTHVPR